MHDNRLNTACTITQFYIVSASVYLIFSYNQYCLEDTTYFVFLIEH